MELPEPDHAQLERLVPDDARGGEDRVVWTGIAWGRLGRGDLAWAWWERAEATAAPGRLEAERATVLSDFGLHRVAERRSRDGLEVATEPLTLARLRTALLSSAVARDDVAAVNLRIEAATALVGCLPPSGEATRLRLRIGLAGAEAAVRCGETPREAVLPSLEDDEVVWPPDYDAAAADDRARGLLVAGRIHEDVGLLTAAADIAPPAIAWQAHVARAEAGVADARSVARTVWQGLTSPPGYAEEVRGSAGTRTLGASPAAGARPREPDRPREP